MIAVTIESRAVPTVNREKSRKSAGVQLFANDRAQIGFQTLARYGAAQRLIDQRLITACAGLCLEVLDNRRIQHDVDAQLGRFDADS